MKKVSIIGIVGKSVFLSVDKLPNGGETVHATNIFVEPGGKGFNQAVAAARFKTNVSFFSAIGNDGYKSTVLNFCEHEGIRAFLVDKDCMSAYAVIQTEFSGENFVSVYGGAKLEVEDLDVFKDEIQTSEYLLITNEIDYAVLEKAVDVAYKSGVKVILNPAPYREIKDDLKSKIYLFTPNEHEIKGLESLDNLIVTMGNKGSFIKSINQVILPTADKAVDTTGAGDTFNGVLVAMLLQGKNLVEAVKIATKAAGKCITKKGAATSAPYYEEILQGDI